MSSASTEPTNPLPTPAPPADPLAAADDAPQWLVVTAGDERFAIPVEQVREVVRPLGLCEVPGAPAVQTGIVNVRGAIVTVLDLVALRGGTRAVAPGSIVLLQYGARGIGMAVQAVHEVRAGTAEELAAHAGLVPLDAVTLCTRHLHSAQERTP
jgi:purine-binding chemotaxis protein CheW